MNNLEKSSNLVFGVQISDTTPRVYPSASGGSTPRVAAKPRKGARRESAPEVGRSVCCACHGMSKALPVICGTARRPYDIVPLHGPHWAWYNFLQSLQGGRRLYSQAKNESLYGGPARHNYEMGHEAGDAMIGQSFIY